MVKKAIVIVVVIIATLMVVTGVLKIQSYLIGIYTSIDVTVGEVQDMQRVWRGYEAWLKSREDNEALNWEREKVKHEIKVLNAVEPFIQALDRANQIGK